MAEPEFEQRHIDMLRKSWPNTPKSIRKDFVRNSSAWMAAAGVKLEDPYSARAKEHMETEAINRMMDEEAEEDERAYQSRQAEEKS